MPEFTRAVLPQLINVGPRPVEASPFQFALSGDERLRIACSNSLAGVKIIVQGKYYTEGGDYSWLRFSFTPTSDRAVHYQDFPQQKSILTNLVAFVEGAAPRVGQTFIQVKLVVGDGAPAFPIGTLMQGYCTAQQELAWPGSGVTSSLDGGGYTRFVNPGAAALGAEVSVTVPSGARWELVAVLTTFLASASVPARKCRIGLMDGATLYFMMTNPVACAASTLVVWQFGQGLGASPVIDGVYPIGGLPASAPILAGQSFQTFTENLDAGDQYTNVRYVVREWLEVA